MEITVKRYALLALCLFVLTVSCSPPDTAAEVASDRLANFQVTDLQGNVIAQIEDLLIDADSGQISYAILTLERGPFSYGKAAFVDASTPDVAVPWDYFSLDSASEQLQLQVDKNILFAAPQLAGRADHFETGWDIEIRAYWQSYPIPDKAE